MKQFTIDIHSELKNVTFTVKNGAEFTRNIIKGSFKSFQIFISDEDMERVKKVAVKIADDKSSNKGKWYAHCNAFAMDLIISYNGTCTINTYRHFGRNSNKLAK